MLSGFLFELSRGNDARTALRRGIAVASKIVSVPGTQMPDADDLDAIAQQVDITDYTESPSE